MSLSVNRDNEQRILSYFMHNPNKWADLLQINEYFNLPHSKNISNGILLLYDKKIEQFDIDTLYNNIIESGKEIEKRHISDIYNNILNFDNIEDAFILLKKDHIRFKVNDELFSDLFSLTNLREPPEFNKLEESLDNVKEALVKIKGTDEILLDSNKLQDKFLDELSERQKIDNIKTTYGDRDLDNLLIYPARPKEMTSIYGQKSSGKSTYILHLINGLIPTNIPVLLISPEDSSSIIMDKLTSMRTDIPFSTITMGNFTDRDQLSRIKMFSDSMRQYHNFFIVDSPSVSIKDAETLIKKVQSITGKEYMIVAVDLLTMLLDFSGCESVPKLDDTMNKWHRVVKSTGVHAINILQENENIWRNNSKAVKVKDLQFYKPTLASIKGGAVLAERSRLVLYIWNFEYMRQAFISDYDQLEEDLKDLEVENDGLPIVEVKVVKNNRGKVGGRLKYIYDGNYFRFTIFKE